MPVEMTPALYIETQYQWADVLYLNACSTTYRRCSRERKRRTPYLQFFKLEDFEIDRREF
jgi:hypothetical protein